MLQRIPIIGDIKKINNNRADKELWIPNDVISAAIFHQSPEKYKKLMEDENDVLFVPEREPRTVKTPQGNKVVSKQVATTTVQFRIRQAIDEAIDECDKSNSLTVPLNGFDKTILAACMTRQHFGYSWITTTRIYHMLGGTRNVPNKKMKQDIINSIDKMRGIDVRIDAAEAYEKLHRLQHPNKPINHANALMIMCLLPCDYMVAYVNGQLDDNVVFFNAISPVFRFALDKNEIVTVPRRLLMTPNINTTYLSTQIKIYIITRVKSIARSLTGGGTVLHNIIDIDTLYMACAPMEAIKNDRKLRKRIRDIAYDYLEFLVYVAEIAGFTCLDDNNAPTMLAMASKFQIAFHNLTVSNCLRD